MKSASRRSFLGLAGAGAATAAIAAVAPAASAKPTALPAGAQGSLVAHVKDVKKGIVTVMVSGHSVDVTDRELVARLATAAAAANPAKA